MDSTANGLLQCMVTICFMQKQLYSYNPLFDIIILWYMFSWHHPPFKSNAKGWVLPDYSMLCPLHAIAVKCVYNRKSHCLIKYYNQLIMRALNLQKYFSV